MIVPNFEIIITKPFPAALIPSPFRFYGDIYKLVYTTSLCGATFSATSRKPAYLKSQVVSLQTAHSWANAGVLLGDACIGSRVVFEAIKLPG